MLQSFTISLCVSFSVFLIMFIESKLFDKDYHKTDYFKIILLCNIMVLSIIYILTYLSSTGSLPMAQQSVLSGATKFIPEIGEQILTRPANI